MTPSVTFSLSMMMKTPQYSGTTLPLTHSLIKYRWNLVIVLYFMMNESLLLNGRINTGSFNVRTTFMPPINPPRIPFVWRILSSLLLIKSLSPILIILSFRIPHILHLCLLLVFLPVQSHFRSPLVAVLEKPRVLSPPKGFRMKYIPPMVLKTF